MMSIQDSKEGVGINGVRFFKVESLLHADETWDRIKVVCSQPYNKCVQYGLSFITVHSATPEKMSEQTNSIANTQSTSSQKLGNFVLKDDPNESTPISMGNWFSKRKAISPPKDHVKVPRTSLASTIKDDSSPQLVKAEKPKKPKKKKDDDDDDYNGKIEVKAIDNKGARRAAGGPLMYVSDEEDDKDKTNNGNSSTNTKPNGNSSTNTKPSTSNTQQNSQGKDLKKDTNGMKDKKKDKDSQGSKDSKDKKDTSKKIQTPQTPSNSQSSSNPKYRTKPFNKLLEGVTFVISGFENPLRSDLRNEALEMGASYKANWDSRCTHLICAFPNTPKCRSVQSLNGKIVTKDWISDCYNQCKRLPWRRYALLRSDQNQSESEEEIHEEKQNKKTPVSLFQATPSSSQATSPLSQASINSSRTIPSSSQATSTLSQTSINSSTSSKATAGCSQSNSNQSYSQPDQSDGDTDIDDCPEFSGKLTQRKFPTIFQNLSFFIHSSLGILLQNKLFRYITTYGGYCACDGQSKYTPIPRPKSDGRFDYICAETLDQDVRIKYSKSIWVQSDWIWDCVEQEKLIGNDKYKINMETN